MRAPPWRGDLAYLNSGSLLGLLCTNSRPGLTSPFITRRRCSDGVAREAEQGRGGQLSLVCVLDNPVVVRHLLPGFNVSRERGEDVRERGVGGEIRQLLRVCNEIEKLPL